MYFKIRKVIKIPFLEIRHENINFKHFNEELSKYFSFSKLCIAQKRLNNSVNKEHVYYSCYISGCDNTYKYKKDLKAHLRKHVYLLYLQISIN
jgi:hypothetical protein